MIGAGQSIGNYRILSKIGTGGMGAVYLAEHPLIGKRVALKVIHRELAGNREVVQRFFQEARAVNTIGNEHIVEIHDFGVTPEGDHFYIMEYLDGRTLASVLAKERVLDVMRALHVGAQIAKALAAAHACGVIHRDLKPDNIMVMLRLGDPDFVKVLDFGLAKMFAENASSVKTAAGVLLGTPQYMSPEACESKRDIDHRTDVYALGVLLFQMMTGVLPFDGESMGEVLVKQVTALPPAPRGINPHIPPSVEQILLRCLAKPVDQRFQSMMALRDALLDPEAYLRGSPPIAPARSVAPGEAKVDARTVIAHAEAMQKTRLAEPAIVVSASLQPTLLDTGQLAPPRRLPTGAVILPGLQPPLEPINHTMRIATPHGYSSRPPRRMWPVVVVLGLTLGLGGGAFSVAWCGQGKAVSPAEATAVDAAPAAVAEVRAADAMAADAAPAAVRPPDARDAPDAAKLTIESVPEGAQVLSIAGDLLGRTPLRLDWPISDAPMEFELRLVGYRKRTKAIVVSGNTTVRLELERLPRPVPPVGQGSAGKGSAGKGSAGSDSALMRPE